MKIWMDSACEESGDGLVESGTGIHRGLRGYRIFVVVCHRLLLLFLFTGTYPTDQLYTCRG